LGNVIEEILLQYTDVKADEDSWLRVISNMMIFDETGVLKGFKDEIIHVFNKKMQDKEYMKKVGDRTNIILLVCMWLICDDF
jgi:hypothetical protein